MRALDASGDRAGALQQARAHEALLQRELGAPPDPDVARLADAMQSGAYVRQAPVPSPRGRRAPEASAPSGAGELQSGRTSGARGWLWAAVLSVTAFTAAGGLAWRQRAAALNAALLPNRVAVALFVNRTGMPALDNLGTMTSDWVAQGLARTSLVDVFDIGGLYVQGRTARGEPADPRSLARANGAGMAVAGNYYKGNLDTLMFSAQVIDVASGNVLRTIEPIAGTVNDPLAAIDEVRQRVTVALRTVLEPHGSLWATPAMVPPRLNAYTEYAAGQELYWNGDWVNALPHFRRAAELDTNFHTALAFVAVAGVGTARCDLADSVHNVLVGRGDRVPAFDLLGAKLQLARCASDHEEHNRLHRQRAALMPGSKFTQMVMSTGFRQLNRPAEALAVLDNIDPSRDLGWLPERGRAFYWREITANHHALGAYDAELAAADRMRTARASPLGIGYFRARAFAALGRAREALAAAAAVSNAANEPPLVSGIVGPLNAAHLASPGWVFYQTALELDAHGDSISARDAAARGLAWFDAHAAREPSPPSERFTHASVLELVGELGRARSMFDALVAFDTARVDYRGASGVVAARQGDTASVSATDAWLAARPVQFPPGLPMLYRAKVAAVRGDTARALELIAALPHGAHPLDFPQFHLDPAFRSLRANAVFRRMLVPRG
jgi:TolB-like protein